MKIIICGAGQVGSSIARQLSGEANDITVIDQNPEIIQKISESLDVKAITGFASHPDVLEAAGTADADMMIAVTYSDEVNMTACQVAHSLFNVPTKIARVRAQGYLKPEWKHLFHNLQLPIDVTISPEIEVAKAVIRRLHVPGALDMIPFAEDTLKVIAANCMEDCPIINLPLHIVRQKLQPLNMSIIGVIHEDIFMLPHQDMMLHEGDDVYFTIDNKNIKRAMSLFGHEEPEAHRVLILGGGNIGLFVAQTIEDEEPDTRVKIIELSRERAEAISSMLDNTTVINGSGLDKEILFEAGVAQADSVIAVSNDDEVNILGSLLSKRHGCKNAITLVNNSSYGSLLDTLGIDVVVNPRETTISSILQHVRRGRIKSVHSIHDGAAEIIEAEIIDGSPLPGKTLDMINFPEGVVIGTIIRGTQVILPTQDTVLEAGDRMILCCLSQVVGKIEKIFSLGMEYF